MQLSDIDLLDRDRFTKGVPHEWFTYLRREAPVYHHPEPGGPGFWVITKHADVVAVGRDGATFSSDQKRGGVVQLEGRPEDYQFEQGGNLMLTMDAPEHTRYRKLVNRGFTPRQMRMIEPHIRDLANQIIDDVIEAGECDFVVDVAAELPLQVIAEMIGVPREDRHKLFEWSNRMIGSEDPEYRVSEEEVQNAQIEMFMYANELAQERRANPRDDIVTALLEAEVDGDQLSEMDFNLFFLLLAVAGNETTRNSISHGVRAFCDYPDQYQLLVEDPSRAQLAAEEVVRWASPVMYFRRNVTTDTELRGQALKAGREGEHLVHLREPRRGRVRGALHVRHHPQPERTRRVRWWRTAPLSRIEPRPDGDLRAARGDGASHPETRADRRRAAAAIELHRRHQAHAGEVPQGVARSRPGLSIPLNSPSEELT